MDTASWILFESRTALAVPLALLTFALLVHWRRGGSPRPLLAGLAAAAVLFVVQALVVTRREHAGRVLREIEAGLLASNVQPLERALAPGFTADEMDARAFVEFVRRTLQRVQITRLIQLALNVTDAHGDEFEVVTRYLSDQRGGNLPGMLDSTWRLRFRWSGDAYQLDSVEPVALQGVDVGGWRDLGA